MLPADGKIKKILLRLAAPAFWLLVWQGAYLIVDNSLLLASPAQALESLLRLVRLWSFWQSVGMSFLRIMSGYAAAVVFGVLLSVLTAVSGAARRLISPVMSVVRSTPVASFIILALFWLKKTLVPVFIVFIIVAPVIWENVNKAISQTPQQYLDVARVYRFGFFKRVRLIYFHSCLPYFAAGCLSSLGLAWKSGAAAEVLAMPVSSIGYNLYRAKTNLLTADLFAWTAVVIILSVLLEKLIRRLLSRQGEGSKNA